MIGAITGSEFKNGDSVWTTEGWTSLMLSLLLGCTVSLVASVSRSTTRGREEEVVGIMGRVPEPKDKAIEKSGVDEPELGKLELDKLVLDNLEDPMIPTTSSSLPLVVERETEATKDTVHPSNNESIKDVQPSVVQTESPILNSEPVVAPIIKPVASPLSLPDLSPTCMNLELADRLISRPIGVAEDVFIKVGTFHFPADFVVVDFDADPRVPLILRRSFLKTRRALIDVFEGDLTLRVGKEAITFNLDQPSR
nr:reverse transcriptase domain-containing protein [Tanacetum cinerariifolium]